MGAKSRFDSVSSVSPPAICTSMAPSYVLPITYTTKICRFFCTVFSSLTGDDGGGVDLMTQSFCATTPGGGGGGSAHRRRTDLMPTITHSMALGGMGYGGGRSPSAASATRTPGRAVSMSRLDKNRLYGATGGVGAHLSRRGAGAHGGSMTTLLHANNHNESTKRSPLAKQHPMQDRRGVYGTPSPQLLNANTTRRKSLSMYHLNQKAAAAQHQLAQTPSPVRQATRRKSDRTSSSGP